MTTIFEKWLSDLSDKKSAARILERLVRVRNGNLGDIKSLQDGVFELRCHFGKGYRIYGLKHGKIVLVLLKGGDKSSQKRDIKQAITLAEE